MRDFTEGKRWCFFNISEPCLFRREWNEKTLVLFCGLSAWCFSLFPTLTMWDISWTKRVKGNNWTWYLEEPNVRELDFRDCQVYKDWLQMLSLEKVSMSSLSTLTNGKWFSKQSEPELALCLLGFRLLLSVSSAVSPSYYFDDTDGAILVCVAPFFQPTS